MSKRIYCLFQCSRNYLCLNLLEDLSAELFIHNKDHLRVEVHIDIQSEKPLWQQKKWLLISSNFQRSSPMHTHMCNSKSHVCMCARTFTTHSLINWPKLNESIVGFRLGAVHKLLLQEEGGRWSKILTFCKHLYHRICKQRGVGGKKRDKSCKRERPLI